MARSSSPEPIEPIWVTPPPRQRLDPVERWFVVVLRIVAFALTLRAIYGWLLITGVIVHPDLGSQLLGTPYVRFAIFGTLAGASMIAALGLWLLAPWGAILWLVIVASDALIFFLLPDLGIIPTMLILINAGLVAIYLGTLLQVRRLGHDPNGL